MPEPSGLIPVGQAARLLMISEERIRRPVKQGYVPRSEKRGFVQLLGTVQRYPHENARHPAGADLVRMRSAVASHTAQQGLSAAPGEIGTTETETLLQIAGTSSVCCILATLQQRFRSDLANSRRRTETKAELGHKYPPSPTMAWGIQCAGSRLP